MHAKLKFLFIVGLLISSISCNKYAATNRVYKKQAKAFSKVIKHPPVDSYYRKRTWVGTTNFAMRKPDFVIIHHTAEKSCPQTLGTFTRPSSQVSAHYVICKDGTVHHMLRTTMVMSHFLLRK